MNEGKHILMVAALMVAGATVQAAEKPNIDRLGSPVLNEVLIPSRLGVIPLVPARWRRGTCGRRYRRSTR